MLRSASHVVGRGLHRAVAALPFGVLVSGFALGQRLGDAMLRRLEAGQPPYRNPSDLDLDLSVDARSAIRRAGGGEAVLASLHKLDRLGVPAIVAAVVKGLDPAAPYLEVSGYEQICQARHDGRRIIVVEPHIGPFFLILCHLAMSGESVATLSALKGPASRWYRRIFELAAYTAPGFRGYEEVTAVGPLAGARAVHLLRSGTILLWNPLVFSFMATSDFIRVRFFGAEVMVAPTIARIAEKVGADLFVATTRLVTSPTDPPRLQLTYEPMDLPASSDLSCWVADLYLATERLVLDNVDQWFGWRWLSIETAAGRPMEPTE